MSEKKYAHSCVLVTRQSLVFYSPEFTDLVHIPLTSEVVLDLEVINQPSLERIIKNWVHKSQYVPKSIAIYFVTDTYFYQDLNKTPESTEDPAVTSFTEIVPFTDLVTKIFPTQGGSRIIAINRDFLQPIISVFEKSGFSVVAAAPSFAAGITAESPFSLEVARDSLLDENVFTVYNFIDMGEAKEKLDEENPPFMSFKIDKKVTAMIGVFVVLIIILIVMVVTMT